MKEKLKTISCQVGDMVEVSFINEYCKPDKISGTVTYRNDGNFEIENDETGRIEAFFANDIRDWDLKVIKRREG